MMKSAEDQWFDDAVRRAEVRRIVPRNYYAVSGPWADWVAGAVLVIVTVAGLVYFFLTSSLGIFDIGFSLIVGFILAAVVKSVLDSFLDLYCVKLTFEGLLLKSPLKQRLLPWEDIATATLNEEVGGGVSYATYSLSIYSFHGEEFRMGPRYEVHLIAADVQQVLQIIRQAEQSRRADLDLTIGI